MTATGGPVYDGRVFTLWSAEQVETVYNQGLLSMMKRVSSFLLSMGLSLSECICFCISWELGTKWRANPSGRPHVAIAGVGD